MLIGYIIATAIRSVVLFAAFYILAKVGMAGTTIGILPIMSAVAVAAVIDLAAGSIAKTLNISMNSFGGKSNVQPGSTMPPRPADTASNQTDVPGGALTTVGAQP